MKVFASWSGGKECTLATYKAIEQGYDVSYLVNFISEDGQRSASHGIKAKVLALQAEAIGIPMVQVKTSWEGYEDNFKRTVRALKDEGIVGGVFGDIYVVEHKEWIERVCGEVGIQPILPLWGRDTSKLIQEFLGYGFKSMVVATQLDEVLLGQNLDRQLVRKLVELGADPCGEKGEYHTFVTGGPIFKKGLKVTQGERTKRDNAWFVDISVELLPTLAGGS